MLDGGKEFAYLVGGASEQVLTNSFENNDYSELGNSMPIYSGFYFDGEIHESNGNVEHFDNVDTKNIPLQTLKDIGEEISAR